MDDRVCHRSLGTARRALTQSEEQGMSEASEGAKVRNISRWECSGGPVLKNPPFSAGDAGSIPGLRTKIPRTTRQLSPCSANCRAHTLPHATVKILYATVKIPHATVKIPHAATKT